MALLTTANAKTLLGITDTSEDAKLALLVDFVDAAIKHDLGIDVESTTYPSTATNGFGDSGFYSGMGTRWLKLRHRPVTAISAIYLDADGYWGQGDDDFPTETLLVEGTDYAWAKDGYIGSAACSMSGIVERLNGVWPSVLMRTRGQLVSDEQRNRGNIKVAYTAGWATVPGDIQQAAYLLLAHYRRIQDKGAGIQGESLGAYSYSMASAGSGAGFPPEVRDLLSSYKEYRLG